MTERKEDEQTQEYFVRSMSNAAPFVSDEGYHYIRVAGDPMERVIATLDLSAYVPKWAQILGWGYRHPSGLFSAALYASADAFHKGEAALGVWLSPRAKEQMQPREDEVKS